MPKLECVLSKTIFSHLPTSNSISLKANNWEPPEWSFAPQDLHQYFKLFLCLLPWDFSPATPPALGILHSKIEFGKGEELTLLGEVGDGQLRKGVSG